MWTEGEARGDGTEGDGTEGGVGKKDRTRPLARSFGVVAFGTRGREAGGGGSRKRFAAHSSSTEAVSRKFRQWVAFALLMVRKYARFAVVASSREARPDW